MKKIIAGILMILGIYFYFSSVQLGLIYSVMVLGIFVSYRILDIPDLTVDSSFTFGAAVSALMAVAGKPIWGLVLGLMAGCVAGLVTALLQTKLKIQPILAGILTMMGLYSINLMVMGGRANIPLLGVETIFSGKSQSVVTIMLLGVVITIVVILIVFLHTPLGLAIRATGDNEDMVKSSSINIEAMKVIGLALANGLVGLSGALLAQNQQFADVNMGVGIVIIGIASVIIGEVCWGKETINQSVIAVVIGSIFYRVIVAIAFDFNISTSSMKLISAIIVVIAISYPEMKNRIALIRRRRAHHVTVKKNL